MGSRSYVRRAAKAGSWYWGEEEVLGRNLDKFLSVPERVEDTSVIKAVIAPHAGYSYSGQTAAYSYKNVNVNAKRVFLLGPAHYASLRCSGLSWATACETPFGDIPVDTEVVEKLKATGDFEWITQDQDEEEHSLELHMPYIAKTLPKAKLVPIMVGHQPKELHRAVAKHLLPYFKDPENFFIISSDFCHWGSRFGYAPYDSTKGEIHEFISDLDHRGMDAISTLDPEVFSAYLKETRNTICGRMPIVLLLHILQLLGGKSSYELEYTHYAQSSKCMTKRDSSVSYVAGLIRRKASSSSSSSSSS